MIRDSERGRIDYILCKSVARFARNTVDSLKMVRKLKAKGIGVYFEEQCLDRLKVENEMFLGLHSVMHNQKVKRKTAITHIRKLWTRKMKTIWQWKMKRFWMQFMLFSKSATRTS